MSSRLSILAPSGETIVAHVSPGADARTVVFVPGFRSVGAGTKAMWFEERAVAAGLTYARFDFRGMGESDGLFEETTSVVRWRTWAWCWIDSLAPRST